MNSFRLSGLITVFALGVFTVPSAQAGVEFFADFNSNDGGFVSTTYNPLNGRAEGPWVYGADFGVGSTGGWRALGDTGGEEFGVVPANRLLTSSVITLTSSGLTTLSFEHNYDFELWNGAGDGGAVTLSVNGGAFTQVAAANFTQNGYNYIYQQIDDLGFEGDMNGQPVFAGNSGGFITTQAILGNFNAGDTLRIQFLGAWDWNGTGEHFDIGWHLDNVQVSSVPVPGAVWLFGSAIAGLAGLSRKSRNA